MVESNEKNTEEISSPKEDNEEENGNGNGTEQVNPIFLQIATALNNINTRLSVNEIEVKKSTSNQNLLKKFTDLLEKEHQFLEKRVNTIEKKLEGG